MKKSVSRKIIKDLDLGVSKFSNEQMYSNTSNIKYKIKNIVINIIPYPLLGGVKKIKPTLAMAKNYVYDFLRFYKFSFAINFPDNREKLKSKIIISYHGIEKALSLTSPRPGFGKDVVKVLIKQVGAYSKLYELDDVVRTATSVLCEYFIFNKLHNAHDEVLYQEFKTEIKNNIHSEEKVGGVLKINRDDIIKQSNVNLSNFFNSRYSVRQFLDKNVDIDAIRCAVAMSMKTPSVCNRQSARVHLFSDSKDIGIILNIQGGAGGFDNEINKLLIVTSDLACFQSIGERYQCWVDGGMFAMSVVYALHSLGLGTCFLNWSKDKEADLRLKQKCQIDNSETIIVVIAVGHLKEEFQVARSKRKNIDEVLFVR